MARISEQLQHISKRISGGITLNVYVLVVVCVLGMLVHTGKLVVQ